MRKVKKSLDSFIPYFPFFFSAASASPEYGNHWSFVIQFLFFPTQMPTSFRPELLTITVAVVAVGVATAYYFYVAKKSKSKGSCSLLQFLLLVPFFVVLLDENTKLRVLGFENTRNKPFQPCFILLLFAISCYFKMFSMSFFDLLFSVMIGCLDPDNFKEFKLVKRTQLSHNVAKFRFSLPTPTSILGLPIGQHMSCRFYSL